MDSYFLPYYLLSSEWSRRWCVIAAKIEKTDFVHVGTNMGKESYRNHFCTGPHLDAREANFWEAAVTPPLGGLQWNHAKTSPKTMSQQTCDFSKIFARKNLCRKRADIDFVLVFPILFACRTLFFKSLLAWILGPENISKTTPKPPPSRPKIDAKNASFFNIDFFGFWGRFWRVLGLQLGAKFAPNGLQT